jgi:hypothetical protein
MLELFQATAKIVEENIMGEKMEAICFSKTSSTYKYTMLLARRPTMPSSLAQKLQISYCVAVP